MMGLSKLKDQIKVVNFLSQFREMRNTLGLRFNSDQGNGITSSRDGGPAQLSQVRVSMNSSNSSRKQKTPYMSSKTRPRYDN